MTMMLHGLLVSAAEAINLPNTLFQGRIKVKILLFCRPFAVAGPETGLIP
jgi:hypothetical protein